MILKCRLILNAWFSGVGGDMAIPTWPHPSYFKAQSSYHYSIMVISQLATMCEYLLALILYYYKFVYIFIFETFCQTIEIDCRIQFWLDNKCVFLTNSTFVYILLLKFIKMTLHCAYLTDLYQNYNMSK